MALYSELQVFKTCYDLLLIIFRATPNVKREYRYCLLENIKKDAMRLCTQIYRCNFSKDKDEILSQALETVMEIRLQCRVLRDLDQISIKLFIQLFENLDSVSKQLTLWRKYHVQNKGKIKPTKNRVPNNYSDSNQSDDSSASNTTTEFDDTITQLANTIDQLRKTEPQSNPNQNNSTSSTPTTASPESETRRDCQTTNSQSIL